MEWPIRRQHTTVKVRAPNDCISFYRAIVATPDLNEQFIAKQTKQNSLIHMALSLPVFPPFDLHHDGASTGLRWKKWLKRFENMITGLAVDDLK